MQQVQIRVGEYLENLDIERLKIMLQYTTWDFMKTKNYLNSLKMNIQKKIKTKLDMGKSCIRFKKIESIPFDLIGKLEKNQSMRMDKKI